MYLPLEFFTFDIALNILLFSWSESFASDVLPRDSQNLTTGAPSTIPKLNTIPRSADASSSSLPSPPPRAKVARFLTESFRFSRQRKRTHFSNVPTTKDASLPIKEAGKTKDVNSINAEDQFHDFAPLTMQSDSNEVFVNLSKAQCPVRSYSTRLFINSGITPVAAIQQRPAFLRQSPIEWLTESPSENEIAVPFSRAFSFPHGATLIPFNRLQSSMFNNINSIRYYFHHVLQQCPAFNIIEPRLLYDEEFCYYSINVLNDQDLQITRRALPAPLPLHDLADRQIVIKPHVKVTRTKSFVLRFFNFVSRIMNYVINVFWKAQDSFRRVLQWLWTGNIEVLNLSSAPKPAASELSPELQHRIVYGQPVPDEMKHRYDFAAYDSGARIIDSSSAIQNIRAIQRPDTDAYLLAPCDQPIW